LFHEPFRPIYPDVKVGVTHPISPQKVAKIDEFRVRTRGVRVKGVRDCQNGDVEKGKFGGGEEVFTDADLCGGGELSCFRREGEFLEIDLQFFCLMK